MLPARGRFAFHAATSILLLAAVDASAEQRTPAVELYGVGNASDWGVLGWRPGLGVGLFTPLGRRWGLLCDLTGSWATHMASYRFSGDVNGSVDGDYQMSFRYSQLSLMPSVVRLWRRERFSVYAGAGLFFRIGWQRSQLRVLAMAEDEVLRRLGDGHRWSQLETGSLLNLRFGVLFSLSPRAVLRTGWRHDFHPEALPGRSASDIGSRIDAPAPFAPILSRFGRAGSGMPVWLRNAGDHDRRPHRRPGGRL